MKFSEFANMLYTYCGKDDTKSEFVRVLTNQIMSGRPARTIGDGHRNPTLDKSNDELNSYFSGNRPIPRSDASIILSRVSKYDFENYLKSSLTDDPLTSLAADLNKLIEKESHEDREYLANRDNVAEKCADIFEKILRELASAKKGTE